MAVDLKRFRERLIHYDNLIYQKTAPFKDIALDVSAIAQIDKAAKAKQKRFRTLLCKTAIVTGILFILLFIVGSVDAYAVLLVLLLMMISLVAMICFGILQAWHGRTTLSNNYRYGTLSKVLPLLGRDLENNANLTIKLVLSKVTEIDKHIDTIPHPSRQNWKIDRFQDDWLVAQGQFIDGTQFALTADELAVAQHGWKISRSGNMKHQRKEKAKALELSLTLTFSRRKYGAISVLKNEAAEAIQLPDFAQLKSLRVKNNQMYLKVKMPPWVYGNGKTEGNETLQSAQSAENLYKTISMMFLSLYQILNLARVLSKKRRHNVER